MYRVRFNLKKPTRDRRSFAVVKDTLRDGKRSYETLELDGIKAVNKAFAQGTLTEADATAQLKDLIAKLKADLKKKQVGKAVFCQANRDLLDQYWEAEYEGRPLTDSYSARRDLERAIAAVGALSLYTAKRSELQAEIKRAVGEGEKQRRVAARLNQLLNFIGRHDSTIHLAKKQRKRVRYLSEPDVMRLLSFIEEPSLRALCHVAFATGARQGECFALPEARGGAVEIFEQVDRKGRLRDPKAGSARAAALVPGHEKAVAQWRKLQPSFKLSRQSIAAAVTAAAQKAFPDDVSKWINFHDLRHSYAKHMLSLGLSITDIALCLGNSVAVCQEYYVGYSHSTESIQAVIKRLRD